MERTDEDWLVGLRADDDAAWQALSDRVRRALQRSFGRQLDAAVLDDLAQDALVRIRERLGDFAGRSRFTTWATAIAVNLTLQELRRKRHQHVSLDEAAASTRERLAAPIDAPLERRELYALLDRGLQDALTERQREALLAKLGGLPMGEVARKLGTNRNALYKVLHDGRRRLRAWLEAEGVRADALEVLP